MRVSLPRIRLPSRSEEIGTCSQFNDLTASGVQAMADSTVSPTGGGGIPGLSRPLRQVSATSDDEWEDPGRETLEGSPSW